MYFARSGTVEGAEALRSPGCVHTGPCPASSEREGSHCGRRGPCPPPPLQRHRPELVLKGRATPSPCRPIASTRCCAAPDGEPVSPMEPATRCGAHTCLTRLRRRTVARDPLKPSRPRLHRHHAGLPHLAKRLAGGVPQGGGRHRGPGPAGGTVRAGRPWPPSPRRPRCRHGGGRSTPRRRGWPRLRVAVDPGSRDSMILDRELGDLYHPGSRRSRAATLHWLLSHRASGPPS